MWREFLLLIKSWILRGWHGWHRGVEEVQEGTIHAPRGARSSATTRRSLLRRLLRRLLRQFRRLRLAISGSLPEGPFIQIVGILQQHMSDDLLTKIPVPPTDLVWYLWIINVAANELPKPPEECSIVLEDLIEDGLTLRLLMSCVERHATNAPIVGTVLFLLWSLLQQEKSLNKPIDAFRADEPAITTLLSVLTQHQDDLLVVQSSWCVFCILTLKEIHQPPQWQPFQDSATIDLLLNCMRAFSDNVTVVMHCVLSLAILVAWHDGNYSRIVDQGGLDEVVNAMIRFPEDVGLKGLACLFWMLVVKPREGPVPVRLVESGAVAEVLSAMSQFRQSGDPSHTKFLGFCTDFLALAANGEGVPGEIVARNGVFEIDAAMNYRPDIAVIMAGGIDVFCQIAKSGQHDDVLVKVGAVDATLAAMERFLSSPKILDSSCQMISYLTDPQRGRGRLLVEEGAIEALVSVFHAAEHQSQDLPVDSVRVSLAALLHVVTSATNLSDEQFLSIFNVCETVALGAFSEHAEISSTVASLAYVLVRFHRLPSLRGLEE